MRRGYFLYLFLLLVVIGRQSVRADEEYISRPSFQEGECNRERAEKAAEQAYGWTSLTLAVLNNDPARVKELLDRGGNINTTDTLNRSLLLLALKHNLDDMGRLLIERGVNVNLLMATRRNRRTWVSNTALTVALRQKNFEMAKLLLQKGATPAVAPGDENITSRTVVQWAEAMRRPDIIQFLREQGVREKASSQAPESVSGEGRRVVFQSEGFDPKNQGTGKPNLERYRVEEETHRSGGGFSVSYFLTIQNSPNRILIANADLPAGKEGDTGIGAQSLSLKWLQEGRLILARWSNGSRDSGLQEEIQRLILSVEGNQVQPVFKTRFQEYHRFGQGISIAGEEEWVSGKKEGELVLNRTETHDELLSRSPDYRPTPRILRMAESNGDTVFVIGLRLRNQYTFRLQGNRLVCVSARKYFLGGNELPLLNIAEFAGFTLPRLWDLNPGTRGDLFCKGTLYLGETEPLRSEPLYGDL